MCSEHICWTNKWMSQRRNGEAEINWWEECLAISKGDGVFQVWVICTQSPVKWKLGTKSFLTWTLTLGSNCIPLVILRNWVTDSATLEMLDSGAWPAQSPTDLALHERVLEKTPPLLQQGAHTVPPPIHLGQAILKILALLLASLSELGAAQMDGEDDGFAVVHSFLELLQRERTIKQGKQQ